MKKCTLVVLVFVFLLSVMVMPANAVQFSDLAPNHWGYTKIMEFTEKGYLSGYTDNTFKPDDVMTRAEFVHVVNNYFGFSGNEDKVADFSDVDQNEWYAKGINEAVARGYIAGYEDKTFRPQNIITRQEAICILANILNIADDEIPEGNKEFFNKYSDADEIADWAKKSVYNYIIKGYIKGYEDGTLRINQPVTRAEAVHLFNMPEEKIVIEDNKTLGSVSSSGGGSSSGGNSGGGSSSTVTYYDITLNVGENGTAVADGTRVASGTTVKITVTPNEKYKAIIKDNAVDVTDKVVENVYIIENVTSNHTLDITFELVEIDTPSEEEKEEEVCKCEECLGELVEVLENIAKKHFDLLVNELKDAKGDAEEIKEIIEKWLKEEISNSEYEEEINELIKELEKIDYNAEAEKVIEKIEEIIYSDMVKDIVSKLEEKINSKISEEDKAKIEELIDNLKNETEVSVEKIKELINKVIENHDCEEVETLVNKIIDFLNGIESMEDLFNKVKDYLDGKISKEDIKDFIEKIEKELGLTTEELKEKIKELIDEEKAEAIEEIQKIIEEIEKEKAEIEKVIKELAEELKIKEEEVKKLVEKLLEEGKINLENLKEDVKEEVEKIIEELAKELEKELELKKEEIKELAEKLLEEGKATLETLKEELKEEIKKQIIENLPTEEELKEEFEKVLEEIKNKISENLPTDEELKDLVDKIETAIPKIEELTGIDLSEIANKLGVDVDTLKQLLEAVGGNEALQEKLNETVKNKLVDILVSTLSDNEDVQKILEKIYEETGTDVIDLVLKAQENGEIGEVIAKVILSNSNLDDVLTAIDNNMANEKIDDVINLTVDYYGLVEVVKAVDYKDDTTLVNAKEILEIALENAGLEDIAKLALDKDAIDILNSYFDVFELTEILGEQGKEIIDGIWDSFDKDKLLEILGNVTDSETIAKITELIKEKYGEDGIKDAIEDATDAFKEFLGTTTVSYDANGGTGSMATSKHYNLIGTKLTKNTFIAPEGHKFSGWSTTKDGETEFEDEEKVKSTEFNKNEVTLYAVWEAIQYNIKCYADNGNSVNSNKSTAVIGDIITLEVTEKEWYKIKSDSIVVKKTETDEIIAQGVYSFTMPACNVEISAEFEYTYGVSYTIGKDINSNEGVINVNPGANAGDTVEFTVEAKDGYTFDSVEVLNLEDNVEVTATETEGVYSFTMPDSNVKISAKFIAIDYTITEYKDEKGNKITVNKTTANVRNEITMTIEPIEGYKLKDGTLKATTSIEVLDIEDNKFTMPANDVTITAEFELREYEIEEITGTNCDVWVVPSIEEIIENLDLSSIISGDFSSVLDAASLEEGDMVKYTSSLYVVYFPNENYTLESFEINDGDVETISGNILGKINYEQLTMPSEDISVVVKCKVAPYSIKVETLGITVNKAYAVAGDTITVSYTPVLGRKLKSVSVIGPNDTVITHSGISDNKCTFTIPETLDEGEIIVTGNIGW